MASNLCSELDSCLAASFVFPKQLLHSNSVHVVQMLGCMTQTDFKYYKDKQLVSRSRAYIYSCMCTELSASDVRSMYSKAHTGFVCNEGQTAVLLSMLKTRQ